MNTLNLSLRGLHDYRNTPDGAIDFYVEIHVWIDGLSALVYSEFIFTVGSLDRFQNRLDNCNKVAWYVDHQMILKTYNHGLIEEEIKKIIAEANKKQTRREAFDFLKLFMRLWTDPEEYFHPILDKELLLESSQTDCWDHRIDTVKLHSGLEYPTDFEYSYEVVDITFVHPKTLEKNVVPVPVITVGWLEREVEEKGFFMAYNMILLRFFDFGLIRNLWR